MLTKEKILDSVKNVVDQAQLVTIDEEAIDSYAKNFVPTKTVHWSRAYPLGYKSDRPKEKEIGFLIVLGNQAFCYWGHPSKWTLEYKGQKLDGWWGNIAAFERALEEGNDISDGNFLADLSLEKTQEIYRGEPETPLLRQRYDLMKALGERLVEKYQGKFGNFFEEHKKDALTLVAGLASELQGFDDVPTYKGKEVYFYKKTQVVLADLHHLVEPIVGIEEMHGFADYKVPAILRTLGLLKYRRDLAEKVDNRVELDQGSEEEIEIRASMLWACQLLAERLEKRGIKLNQLDLQNVLWIASQDKTKLDKPYHLTQTIYY
ncbi:MAG: queuosine salvage family protein [bacterium]|nr:queuosine salvage family protein [bacterium]